VLDFAIPVVVVLLLAAPALFTKDGFIDDWVNHLWLTWMQSREIRATGHPGLFLHAEPLGVFYPNFAFYGGTLYAIGGYLMVLTGAPVATFVAMIVLSFVAAYGGTLWVGRQLGVRGVVAHMPAIIVVTGAYYLSLAYGRGSWPELVATSMVPLIIAAALRMFRTGARPGVIVFLAGSTAIWSGSHNITLAWGTIFLVAMAVCALLAWVACIKAPQLRRIATVLGVMALGIMLNGWFLLPDIAYSLNTEISQYRNLAPAISGIFSRLSVVFDPLRDRATQSSYLRSHFTELPVLVIVWIVAALAIQWRSRWNSQLRRLAMLLILLLAVLLVLLVDEQIWNRLPSTLSIIQFTFRLQTYIVMTVAGLVAVVLAGMSGRGVRRREAVLGLGLAASVLIGLSLGIWQVWNSDAGYYPESRRYLANRDFVLRYPYHTPPTWYDPGQFRDIGDQVVPTDGAIHLDASEIHGEATTQAVTVPLGEGPVATNIAASIKLVSVRGLRVAGRTSDGFLALERPRDGEASVRLSVSRADTAPMRLGPLVTLLGAIGLAGSVVFIVVRGRRRSRRPGV
jgi:hypothetical protein